MNIRHQEEIGVEVVVEGNPRMALRSVTGEVAYLGLTAPGDFEFKGAGLPKVEAVLEGRGWNMRLKEREYLIGRHRK